MLAGRAQGVAPRGDGDVIRLPIEELVAHVANAQRQHAPSLESIDSIQDTSQAARDTIAEAESILARITATSGGR